MKLKTLLFSLFLFFSANPVLAQFVTGFPNVTYPDEPGSAYAVEFNAGGDYVSLPANSFSASSGVTIEAWIRNSGGVSNEAPISIAATWYIRFLPSGNFISVFDGNDAGSTPTTAPTDGRWHHYAAVYDQGTTTTYLDGIAVATHAETIAAIPAGITSTIGGLFSTINPFTGSIDEVRIWNAALPTTLIREWIAKKVSSRHDSIASLTSYYRFDDNTGTTLEDLSGGNDGTFFGTPTWIGSGAALGDSSIFVYPATSLSIGSPLNDTLILSNITGAPLGAHVYFVNDTAINTTSPPGLDSIYTTSYFGSFLVGGVSPTYDVEIKNNSTPLAANELFEGNLGVRVDNAAPWEQGNLSFRTDSFKLNGLANKSEFAIGTGANNSISFDGVDDYVNIPHDPQLNFPGAFTVELSVQSSSSTNCVMIEKNQNLGFSVQRTATGRWRMAVNGGFITSTTSSQNDGEWHHLAVVYNGPGDGQIYIDGIDVTAGGPSPNTPIFSTAAVNIGGRTNTLPFDGSIDEVRLWNRALCVEEINANKNCAQPGNTDSLVAYYNFNQATAQGLNSIHNTLTDLSGNALTGTLTNMALTGPVSNWSIGSDSINGTCGIFSANPVAVTQNITAYLDATGNVTIAPADVDNGSSVDCGVATLSLNNSAFNCTNLGANPVILTVTDGGSNTDSAPATVTIEDTISPVAIAQNITVQLDLSNNASIVAADVNNGSSDNCGTVTLSVNVTSFTCTDVGVNNVILTVTDGSGNTSTATAVVTVEDTVPPVAIAQNITVPLDGTGNATITGANIDNGSSDNCGAPALSVNISAFTCADLGPNNVILTATDGSGNTSTASAVVTITDVTAPTTIVQNIAVFLDGAGNATISTSDINNGSTDNCGISSLSLSNTAFTCGNLGANFVFLTATDASSNSSSSPALVIVQDTIRPTAVAQNIVAYLDGTGNVVVPASAIDNGSTDNCVPVTLSSNNTMFTCADLGANNATLTVTDLSGNVDSASAVITVQDTLPATIITQPTTVYLDAAGNGSITVADVNNGTVDNCGIASLALSNNAFTCANLGANVVQLITTDINGNVDSASVVVTVLDTISPSAVAQNITAYLDGAGNITIVPADVDNGSTDNCGVPALTLNTSAFTCANTGANNVILTATDASSNSANAAAVVTVLDTLTPTVITQPVTVFLDGAGNASLVVADINNGTSDNCGIASLALSNSTFTCADIGVNNVQLIATDVNGNIDSAVAVVTVSDTLRPSVITQPVTVFLDGAGNASIVVTNVNNGTADNCGVASLTLSNSTFTCADVGANNVQLIATDVNGNVDSALAVVTVNDTTSPNVITQPVSVFLDGAGNASIVVADVDNGTSDNCGIASLTLSSSTFTCADLGANNVQLIATDVNGNIDSAIVVVTVNDTTSPTAIAQNITVYLDGTGNVTITPADVDNSSTDNCGAPTLTLNTSAFTCASIGANNVTLTATDGSSNTATASAVVTVLDTLTPAVITQPVTVFLDGAGNASIIVADVNNGTADNCGIASLTLSNSNFTCADVGTNNVQLIAIDVNGNIDSAVAVVTVSDTLRPSVITQPVTVFLDGAGSASIVATDVNNGTADNCGIASLALSNSTFTCADLGANNVQLIATDVNGNIDSAIAVVTVNDTTSPTAIAQNITVYLDGTGNVTITPADVDNGSTDNCGAPSLTLNTSAFTCANIGPNNVTLTATDASSNSTNAAAIVTVLDTLRPNIITQPVTIFLDGAGNASIVAADIDNGTSDNCGIASLAISNSAFTCADLGANNVQLIATDVNGNIDSAIAVVTVNDTTSPTAITQNITVYLDGTGNVTITPSDVDNGSTDNCGAPALSIGTSAFTCANIGANNVTLTTTDGSSNTATATAVVTVLDTTSPSAIAQNITVYLDATGNVTITPSDVDNGSTDNCGAPTLTLNTSAFTCVNIGTNNVTLTATDGSSNSTNAAAIVTVLDTLRPNIITQPVTIFLDGAGNASIVAADIDNGTSDNCGIASLTLSNSAFTCADLGANNVQLIATDVNGNIDSAVAVVTVNDTTSPTAIAQNIIVYLDGTGNVTIISADIDNGSTDNCGAPALSISNTAFTCANIGANNVTLTATDGSSNTATATAVVTVLDTNSPSAIAQNIIVFLDGTGNVTITPADVDIGSTDNCGAPTLTLNTSAFTCANIGANNVTLTATDASSNSTNIAAVVTVSDTTSPNVITQPVTVFLDGAGNASIVVADVDNGTSDNCGIASLTLSSSTFTCADLGANNVQLIATDVNGNIDSAVAVVTVSDTTSPVATTQNITVFLDGAGNATIIAADVDNGSTDNCGTPTLSIGTSAFTCANIGANNVTLTTTDGSSNTATASAVVTVLDTLRPSVVTQPVTVFLDATGNASIVVADVNNGTADNCAIASLTLSNSAFTCADVGANNIQLIATDVNGNSDSVVAVVTVNDSTRPNVVSQPVSVFLDAAGNASIVVADVNNGTADNCAIASLTLSNSVFTCADVGANNVQLIATDVNGNIDSAIAVVTVNDTTSPTAIAQNITVYLNGTGNVTITPADVDNGSTDNCGAPTLILNTSAFTCANIGANNVILTATDASSNSANAAAVVTVLDTLRPSVVTQPVTVFLDATGNASIVVADVNNGTADNCGIASLTLSNSTFTCADVGTNNVQLIATDVNGNIDSAVAVVTVSDTIPTTAIVQNINVYLDGTGNATIAPTDVDNGSADNCGTITLSLDSTNFDCSEIGANNVTLYVTDASANVDSAIAIVTVLDTIRPVVSTQSVSVFLDAAGNASVVVADIDNGSADNCGAITMNLDSTNFDCSEIGPNTVTLYVTDASANVDSATAVVTVNDTTSPNVITQSVSVFLDATGNASITTADVDNGTSDNCALASLALSNSAFTCANVGANNVQLIATDVNGNIDSAGAIVTVNDTVSPTAIAQNITVYLDGTGNVSITAADLDNGSADNCGALTLSLDSTNFDCSEIGTNNVKLYASDNDFNVDSAIAVVTVLDTLTPTVITQNITAYLGATGNVSIIPSDIDNGSTDNCGTINFTLDSTNFDCSEVGANVVTLFVTDANSNVDSATAIVTVLDTLNPTVTTQNITAYLDATGNVTITPGDIDNGSIDNCGTFVLTLDSNNFDCSELGLNNVKLYVTDASSNIDSATAIVTILDTLNPTVITRNITAYLDASGAVSITSADIDNGSADNCGAVTLSIDSTNFDCSEIGSNVVTLFVNDASFNVDSATAVVTILDTLIPTVITQNVTVYLDASGSASIAVSDIDNGSTDNCGTVSLALDSTNFDCSELGANIVTLFATDANSSVDSATAIVTVLDTLNPTVLTQNINAYLDATGNVSITPTDIDNGSFDNCGAISLNLDSTNFDCSEVGVNSVKLYATDASSNVDSATAIVTVLDTLNPTIVTQNITVYLDASGSASITTADIDNGSTDNCGAIALALDSTNFDCSEVGVNVVTLFATDANFNVDSATAIVTVLDTLNPTIITQNVTVYLDATGNASITPADIDNGSIDNCGSVTLALDSSNFDCSEVGINNVKLFVTDGNSNVDSTTTIVTVVDTIIPVITCRSDTVICDATFLFSTPAGTDNCAVQSIVQTAGIPSGNPYPVGTTINTFVITDVNGNVDSCSFTVTREDFPTTAIAGTDSNICVDSFALNANSPVVGVGTWSTTTVGVTFDNNLTPSTTVRNLIRGDNILIWTITNGVCNPSKDTITITYDDQPTIAFAGNDQTLCDIYELTLGGNNPAIGTGMWTVTIGSANISNPSAPNSIVTSLSDGLNQFVWTTSNGTCNISSDSVNILVSKSPVVDIGPDRTIFRDDGTNLSAVVTPDSLNNQNLTYQWQPSFFLNDPTVSSTNTNSSFAEDTEFTIEVTSEQGCIGRDTATVFVKSLLQIPTSFTPNGDGINDVWEIKNFEQYAQMRVIVYDPLGSEVYSSSNYDYWDGRRNGNELPVTSYHYIITVTDFSGKTEALSGIVTILR